VYRWLLCDTYPNPVELEWWSRNSHFTQQDFSNTL
jgi:hypothetical protein